MREAIIAWTDRTHLTEDQRQAAYDVLADMAQEYRDAERAWSQERVGHPHDPWVSEESQRASLATDLAPELYQRLAAAVGPEAARDFEAYNGPFVAFILRYDVVTRAPQSASGEI